MTFFFIKSLSVQFDLISFDFTTTSRVSKSSKDVNIQKTSEKKGSGFGFIYHFSFFLRQSLSEGRSAAAALSLAESSALPQSHYLSDPLCSSCLDPGTARPRYHSNAARPVFGSHKSPSHCSAFNQLSPVSPCFSTHPRFSLC